MGEWLRAQPAGPGAVAEAALQLYEREAGTIWTEMITDTDLLFFFLRNKNCNFRNVMRDYFLN